MATNSFTVATYNLHGINQGREMLEHLCIDNVIDIIYIQEYWVTPYNMHSILNFSTNYSGFGISARESAVTNGVLVGRPLGGACILINNKHILNVKCHKTAESFVIVSVGTIVYVIVYMPYNPSAHRNNEEFMDILSDISLVLDSMTFTALVFGRDVNTNLSIESKLSDTVASFVTEHNLVSAAIVS